MMFDRFNRERNVYPYINKLHHTISDPNFEILLLLSQFVMQAQQVGICTPHGNVEPTSELYQHPWYARHHTSGAKYYCSCIKLAAAIGGAYPKGPPPAVLLMMKVMIH